MNSLKLKINEISLGQLPVQGPHVFVTRLVLNVDGIEHHVVGQIPLVLSAGKTLSISLEEQTPKEKPQ